jgi:hypothetical protein
VRQATLFARRRLAASALPLEVQLRAAGLPPPTPEVRFHPTRKWRFDLAWPTHRIAFEIEGGAFTGGRHTTGVGLSADCEKYSWAAILGWCVVRATPTMIRQGVALVLLEAAFAARGRGNHAARGN